ncbi:MAG: PilN domain-containing protein [Bdellovibrionales bacterium]|nr:PilN domain-containing protein [Bdellovibrionales bacterium]
MIDKKTINLIPESRRLQLPINWDYMLLAVVLVVTSIISVQFVEGTARKIKLTKELSEHQAARTVLLDRIKELKGRSSVADNEKEQEELIQKIIGKRLGWEDAFKELGLITPDRTWLTEMMAKSVGGKIALAIQGSTDSQINMARFFSALEKSEHFRDVLLIRSERIEDFQPPLFEFYFAAPGVEIQKKKEDEKKVAKK